MKPTEYTTYSVSPKVKHRWEVCTLDFRMFCNRCHKYPEYAGEECHPPPPATQETPEPSDDT
jgi:hypothetical protein